MSGPSYKAVQAAEEVMGDADWLADEALTAAHKPSLGLDRSVCLRDVLDWLDGRTGAHGGGFTSADDVRDAIEREFGGES